MHQSGRGRRVSLGWHGRTVPGRFPERAAAPQLMRGRSLAPVSNVFGSVCDGAARYAPANPSRVSRPRGAGRGWSPGAASSDRPLPGQLTDQHPCGRRAPHTTGALQDSQARGGSVRAEIGHPGWWSAKPLANQRMHLPERSRRLWPAPAFGGVPLL
jgi:hypothetical protein